jgi:hypothetical protein
MSKGFGHDKCVWEFTISPRVLLGRINYEIARNMKLIENPEINNISSDYVIEKKGAIKALEELKDDLFNYSSLIRNNAAPLEKLLFDKKAEETMQELKEADIFKRVWGLDDE